MTTTMPSHDTISATDLRQLVVEDPNLRIVDVRTGGEFETVHIPGSYNIPLNTVYEHVSDLANIHNSVVLVCQSGARASQAHTRLTSSGKHTVHILEGGIEAWESQGGDVTRGTNQRWAMDRQVRLVAGSLVLTGVAVSTVFPKTKWLAGAVGAGLTFSAVSNTCAMANLLGRLPYNRVDGDDIEQVLNDLTTITT